MKSERKFCKCSHCGNIICFVKNAGVGVSCCGEKMIELKPNTTDGATEKHVPVAVREGNKLIVTVGSVLHPMTAEHHIAWIVVVDGNRTQRVALSITEAPTAEFFVSDAPLVVYEYCNLHGLWETQLQ
jgi:superoxide reductase